MQSSSTYTVLIISKQKSWEWIDCSEYMLDNYYSERLKNEIMKIVNMGDSFTFNEHKWVVLLNLTFRQSLEARSLTFIIFQILEGKTTCLFLFEDDRIITWRTTNLCVGCFLGRWCYWPWWVSLQIIIGKMETCSLLTDNERFKKSLLLKPRGKYPYQLLMVDGS